MEIKIQKSVLIVSLVLIALLVAGLLAWKFNLFNLITQNSTPMETRVEIKTNMGSIKVVLFSAESPVTVENFLKHVNDQYYDGLVFHRVIDGFMIQGGGFYPGLKNKEPAYSPIKNEAKESGLKNERGTLAMARTMDPNSATSQFFINTVDNAFLNPGGNDPNGYAVFGKVYEGMDIVDRISKVETGSSGMFQDVPVEDVVIESIKVIDS